MSTEISLAGWPLVLRLDPVVEKLTDRQFFEFCRINRDWRIERTSQGEVLAMPPAGGESGRRGALLIRRLGNWAEADGTGVVFDSSTGFRLPSGAIRSPDAAWVRRERWESLAAEDREDFLPLCPDFVVELRSRTDRLAAIQEKMQEYLANGAQLGWLIDPTQRKVYVYRPGQEFETHANPAAISGEPVLKSFTLELREIWTD